MVSHRVHMLDDTLIKTMHGMNNIKKVFLCSPHIINE